MADSGIKKVIIQKKNLPSIFGTDNKYIVRYRIISEDRNRTSHWSPQYKLSPKTVESINYAMSVDTSLNIITLIWAQIQDLSEYDVYVKWDSESWEYLGSTSNNTYSCLIKEGITEAMLAVQVPTFPKNRFSTSTLFETEITTF